MFLIPFYFESFLHPIPEHLAGENSNSERYWYVCVCVCARARALSCFSHVRLFAILWTGVHQALLSMGFSRQEYWSRLPRPPPGDIPNPGTEPLSPASPALNADSLPLSHWGSLSLSLSLSIYTHTRTHTHTHTHIYVCLNHFAVHLKLTQLCVSTILQQKTKGMDFIVCDYITVNLNVLKMSPNI